MAMEAFKRQFIGPELYDHLSKPPVQIVQMCLKGWFKKKQEPKMARRRGDGDPTLQFSAAILSV